MSGIESAVNDLRRQRRKTLSQIASSEAGQTLMKIDAALEALTGEPEPGGLDISASRRTRGRKPTEGSVRDKAQKLLDEADLAWTYDGILGAWEERGDPIKATDPKGALRTAVASMVNAGDALRVGEGRFVSTKWKAWQEFAEDP